MVPEGDTLGIVEELGGLLKDGRLVLDGVAVGTWDDEGKELGTTVGRELGQTETLGDSEGINDDEGGAEGTLETEGEAFCSRLKVGAVLDAWRHSKRKKAIATR